jgi:hypothetical protein
MPVVSSELLAHSHLKANPLLFTVKAEIVFASELFLTLMDS